MEAIAHVRVSEACSLFAVRVQRDQRATRLQDGLAHPGCARTEALQFLQPLEQLLIAGQSFSRLRHASQVGDDRRANLVEDFEQRELWLGEGLLRFRAPL